MINSCEPKHLTLFANIAMARRVFKLIMSHAKSPKLQAPHLYFHRPRSMRVQAAISAASRLSAHATALWPSVAAPNAHGSRQLIARILDSPFSIPDTRYLPPPSLNAINWKFFRGLLAQGLQEGHIRPSWACNTVASSRKSLLSITTPLDWACKVHSRHFSQTQNSYFTLKPNLILFVWAFLNEFLKYLKNHIIF